MLRGASWINNDRDNLLSSNRNNDHPGNRNDNNGFRCVVSVVSPKAGRKCPEPGLRDAGGVLPFQPVPRCISLTCVPAPEGPFLREKTRKAAVTRHMRATAVMRPTTLSRVARPRSSSRYRVENPSTIARPANLRTLDTQTTKVVCLRTHERVPGRKSSSQICFTQG